MSYRVRDKENTCKYRSFFSFPKITDACLIYDPYNQCLNYLLKNGVSVQEQGHLVLGSSM